MIVVYKRIDHMMNHKAEMLNTLHPPLADCLACLESDLAIQPCTGCELTTSHSSSFCSGPARIRKNNFMEPKC